MIKNSLILGLIAVVVGVIFLSTRSNTTVLTSTRNTSQTAGEKKVLPQPTPTPTNSTQSSAALTLSNAGLTSVSQDIFTRTELTTLDLSHNQLSGALPAEVRHLSHLTTLDLSYNQFTGVPAEVGQLTLLTSLNLSHNPITGLPLELGNLSHLEVLNLSGTQYSKTDLEQIRKKLPTTTVIITN